MNATKSGSELCCSGRVKGSCSTERVTPDVVFHDIFYAFILHFLFSWRFILYRRFTRIYFVNLSNFHIKHYASRSRIYNEAVFVYLFKYLFMHLWLFYM